MLTKDEVASVFSGMVASKPVNDAAMSRFMTAFDTAKSAVTSSPATSVPYDVLQGTGSAVTEAGEATTTYVSDYSAAVTSGLSKSELLSAASTAAKGVGLWQGAQAIKNGFVISNYAQEEQAGTLIVPDTYGRAAVRDFTNTIENAKKTGSVSEKDLFNLYGDGLLCQVFGAEGRFDPNAKSPIAALDVSGRYGDALKKFTYEKSGRETNELMESKSQVRERRAKIAEIRTQEFDIPSIEEQLSYRRDYSKG